MFLLLKSSDLVQYDLQHVHMPTMASVDCGSMAELDTNTKPYLVLRRWSNMYLSNEYRCFVRDGRIRGA